MTCPNNQQQYSYGKYPSLPPPPGGMQDPYNNITMQTPQQQNQLNLFSMMPQSFTSSTTSNDPWSRNNITYQGYQRYISGSGANQFAEVDRSSMGRRLGTQNLLRAAVPINVQLPPNGVLFGDSPDRQAIAAAKLWGTQ